jgi:hypothetical protein
MNNDINLNIIETIGKLTTENLKLNGILVDIIRELSVIYPKHEIETLPAKVRELVQRVDHTEKYEFTSLEELRDRNKERNKL